MKQFPLFTQLKGNYINVKLCLVVDLDISIYGISMNETVLSNIWRALST